jgi:hypothetical protein
MTPPEPSDDLCFKFLHDVEEICISMKLSYSFRGADHQKIKFSVSFGDTLLLEKEIWISMIREHHTTLLSNLKDELDLNYKAAFKSGNPSIEGDGWGEIFGSSESSLFHASDAAVILYDVKPTLDVHAMIAAIVKRDLRDEVPQPTVPQIERIVGLLHNQCLYTRPTSWGSKEIDLEREITRAEVMKFYRQVCK